MKFASFPDEFLCRILRGQAPAWPADGQRDFDDRFLQRAEHHGVRSLVLCRMREADAWGTWPERVRSELNVAEKQAVAFDMLRGLALDEVFRTLADRGLGVLLTKGEALAASHYRQAHVRSRCDTDIFIDISDIQRVAEALQAAGFAIESPVYKSHQFVCTCRRRSASVQVDVHWRILNAARFARTFTFSDAWKRSVPVSGKPAARRLCDVDLLLLACMHRRGSALHDADRLIWLYDIHLLGSAMSTTDWNEFRQRAIGKRVARPCVEGLQRARDCFETPIPEAVLAALDEAAASAGQPGRFASSHLALLCHDLVELPGWRTRWQLLVELLFPRADWLLHRYGKRHRVWLPVLYLRQVIGGAFRRLSLR